MPARQPIRSIERQFDELERDMNMRVSRPSGNINQPGGQHMRSRSLDRHGQTKRGDSVSEAHMKIDTRQPRRRAPRKNSDPSRGQRVDVTI